MSFYIKEGPGFTYDEDLLTKIQKSIRARLEESRGEYVSVQAIADSIGRHVETVAEAVESMYFKSVKTRDMARSLGPDGWAYRLKEEA